MAEMVGAAAVRSEEALLKDVVGRRRGKEWCGPLS